MNVESGVVDLEVFHRDVDQNLRNRAKKLQKRDRDRKHQTEQEVVRQDLVAVRKQKDLAEKESKGVVAAWEASREATKKLTESLVAEIHKTSHLEKEVERGRLERAQLEHTVTELKEELRVSRAEQQSQALVHRLSTDQQARQIQALTNKK
jgi:hypothetical protein